MAPPQTNIELYTAGTPNGQKINILLEELSLSYTVHAINIAKNEQKTPSFLSINPNGRIPAILDHTNRSSPFRVFEGGAIMLYLCDKYDSSHRMSFPHGSDDYYECQSWVTWMQSGIGPMQGQANHFYRYAPQKIEYAINRYQTETKRLYEVLNARLKAQKDAGQGLWLVGGRYSIADLACFSWVNWAEWALGREWEKSNPFPEVSQWLRVIQEREATKKGVDIPEKFEMKEAMETEEGEREYAKHHSNWVMQGQKEDQEKHK